MNDGNIFTGKKPREDALRVLVDVVVAHAVHCTTDVGRVNQLLCLGSPIEKIPGIPLGFTFAVPSGEAGVLSFLLPNFLLKYPTTPATPNVAAVGKCATALAGSNPFMAVAISGKSSIASLT